MKKNILKTIFLIIFIIGASEALAQFSSAPASNTETPINTSSAAQIKTGDISVNTFTVSKSAQFEKGVILQGILLGNSTGANTSTLKIGGLDPANIQRIVDVLVPNGKITVSNTVTLASLIGSQPTNKELCATNTGTVVFCGDSTVSTSTTYCGNGTVEGTEACDDGDLNGTSASNCSLICQNNVSVIPPRTAVTVKVIIANQIVLPMDPITHLTYPCNPRQVSMTKTAYMNTSVLTSSTDLSHEYLYEDQTTNYPALLGLGWNHNLGGAGGYYDYALVEVGGSQTLGGITLQTAIYGYSPYVAQQFGNSGPATYALPGQLSGDLGSCSN